VKVWNGPLAWFVVSGLFNVIFRQQTGAVFQVIRAISFDPVQLFRAVRSFTVREPKAAATITYLADEGPTPVRVSQLPTLKVAAVPKPDGHDRN
jgi:hypothetical protein